MVGQPLSVEDRPFLELGTARGDSAQELYRVVTPFLLPSGDVAVPLRAYGEIRIFSPLGELVAIHGRPGEGPGEFRDLGAAWANGDTIEAFDGRLRRITRFLPKGATETVQLQSEGIGFLPNVVIPGAFHSGWLVTGVTGLSDSQRMMVSVARFSRSGAFLGVIARGEGPEMYSALGTHGPTPLSPMMFSSIGRNALYVGETLVPAIRVVNQDGDIVREITWEPEAISPRDALREVIDLAVREADPANKPGVRDRLRAAPAPDGVPVFSEFMVDDLGFIWVRPFEVKRDAAALWGPRGAFESRAGGVWWTFTPTGENVGSVEIPPGLEPYDIGVESVIGIRRDELGVEFVQVHRLHRATTER